MTLELDKLIERLRGDHLIPVTKISGADDGLLFTLPDGGYIRIYESSRGHMFIACNGFETSITAEDILKVMGMFRIAEKK